MSQEAKEKTGQQRQSHSGSRHKSCDCGHLPVQTNPWHVKTLLPLSPFHGHKGEMRGIDCGQILGTQRVWIRQLINHVFIHRGGSLSSRKETKSTDYQTQPVLSVGEREACAVPSSDSEML